MNITELNRQFVGYLNNNWQGNVKDNLQRYGIASSVQHCKKQQFVFRQGEKVDAIWFLVYGTARYITISEEGKEFVKHFVNAPGVLGSTKSSLTNTVSHFGVQAMSDCLLLKVDWQSFHQAVDKYSEVGAVYRRFLEDLFIKKEQRELDFVQKSAEQRYLELQQSMSGMMADIPLQDIASYIGVTPVALSRIRKRLS